MINGMVYLHFGSLSLYFIVVSRVACGPNRVNAIDVIAVFPKDPRQMTA